MYTRAPEVLNIQEEAELRELGANDEYIENKRAHLEAVAGENEVEVEVWPDMESQIRVFQYCKWTAVAGMAGMFYTGIAATEIESVSRMLKIELTEQMLGDLMVMEAAARAVINAKN